MTTVYGPGVNDSGSFIAIGCMEYTLDLHFVELAVDALLEEKLYGPEAKEACSFMSMGCREYALGSLVVDLAANVCL
jgi:hypothetical protein